MVTKKEREKRRKELEKQRKQSIPKDSPLLPEVTQTEKPEKEGGEALEAPKPDKPVVIRAGKGEPNEGEVTGVRLPDGRTFLGIGREEVQAQVNAFLGKRAPIEGAIEAGELQELSPKERVEIQEIFQLGDEEVPEGFEAITEEPKKEEKPSLLEAAKAEVEKTQILPAPMADALGIPREVKVPFSIKAGIATVATIPLTWSIPAAGVTTANAGRAVKLANTLKAGAKARGIGATIRDFAIGGFAAIKTIEGATSYFGRAEVIDEQQQAVNTIGQMATSISGQATEPAGDWRTGLNELEYIRGEILRLSTSIKSGQISSAVIKFNGKIYDINADIEDQLRTIDEEITRIRSFALQGVFPEMSDQEIQAEVLRLTEEGLIKPLDITKSRRPTPT